MTLVIDGYNHNYLHSSNNENALYFVAIMFPK